MRLIDRKPEIPIRHEHAVHGRRVVPILTDHHAALASVRYVLDLPASNACGELIRSGEGLFEADNPLFRMPAETFWVELFEERAPGAFGANRRLGYLVQAAADGRSGTITPFAETNTGLCRRLPCQMIFDLRQPMTRPTGGHSLRNPELPHLADLLEHCILYPDREGLKDLRPGSDASATVLAELAQGTWYALPLLFAFVALLNSPQVVDTRASDLARLNRERIKRGRQPLLDHVEVRLSLGDGTGAGRSDGIGRTVPRLHFVRGHVVHRDGKTFWRQAHLRGDSHKAIVSKTVRVTAGQSVRSNAARHVRSAISAM
jgi:hypothetical protein